MRVEISKPYFDAFYKSKNHNIIAPTPRTSGKSYEVSLKVATMALKYPKNDIIVFRANANSLLGSVCNDVLEKFDLLGYGGRAQLRSAPLRIEVDGKNAIYFLGVSGHDKSRVRGFHPKHKLSMIVGDECQQISELDNLTHAMASFRRYLDTTIDYRIILCGNPHEVKGHWWNVYCAQRREAKDYSYINATYKDIYGLLNDADKEEIELLEKISPALYRFMYLGDLSGINGGAYPSFDRTRHLKTKEEAEQIFAGRWIDTIIIGGDGAIKHDMTCFNCIAIMNDGRACVLEPFIFNPLAYGSALAPSQIADLVAEYLNDLEEKYAFQRNNIPVYIIIDCAASDLITQLTYQVSDYYTVMSFTEKHVVQNTATANNVFARNMCYIINYGGYKDYATGKWVQTAVPLLCEQLETVVWKNSKLDPSIPNDCSDSFVYGICTYYENPQNLNLPERMNYYD